MTKHIFGLLASILTTPNGKLNTVLYALIVVTFVLIAFGVSGWWVSLPAIVAFSVLAVRRWNSEQPAP